MSNKFAGKEKNPHEATVDHTTEIKFYDKNGMIVLPEQVKFYTRECTIFCAKHGGSWRAKVSKNSKQFGHYCEICAINSGFEVE